MRDQKKVLYFSLLILSLILLYLVGNFFLGYSILTASESVEFNFPQNKNTLCIYNLNSEISKEVCRYYNESRYNYSVEQTALGNYPEPQEINLIGLDINNSKFLTKVGQGIEGSTNQFNAFREDMVFEDFLIEVYEPFKEWISENQDKNITHLAIAKDIPIRIRMSEDLNNVRSTAGYIATNGGNSGEFMESPVRFNPDNFENLTYAVSYLTGYNLSDIKKFLDKAVFPPEEDLVWTMDRDIEMTEINSVDYGANHYTGGRVFSFQGVNYTLKYHSIFGVLDSPVLIKNIHLRPINSSLPSFGMMKSEESGRDYIFNISASMANITKGDIYSIEGNECTSIHTIIHPGFYSAQGPSTNFVFNCPSIIDFAEQGKMIKILGGGNETYQYLSNYLVPDTLNFTRTYNDYGFTLTYRDTSNFDSISNKLGKFLGETYVENTNSLISIPLGSVIMFMNPGVYHASYGNLWGTKNFNMNVSNRAVVGAMESFSGLTFSGNSSHTGYGDPWQGKIADLLTEKALGGENYSKSFSGGFAHISEPGLKVERMQNFLKCYKGGLTLGECYLMMPTEDIWGEEEYEGRVIIVGDPLMRIMDSNEKKVLGDSCQGDSDCLTNNCVIAFNGNKYCYYNESSCLVTNMYSPVVLGLPNQVHTIGSIESEKIWCINENSYKSCLGGIWSEELETGENFTCNGDYISRLDYVGKGCNFDSDCSYMGVDFYCSEDLYGEKRCHSILDSCIVNSSDLEVPNLDYVCIDNKKRKQCNNQIWSSEVETCSEFCEEGLCKSEKEASFTFNLSFGESYYLSLPLKPYSNYFHRIFSDADNSSGYVGPEEINTYSSSGWKGYYRMEVYEEPYAKYNGLWAETNLYSGMSVPSIFLPDGEGFNLNPYNEGNLTIYGTTYEEPVELHFDESMNLVGMPFCYEDYNASKWLSELQEIDSACTSIFEWNVSNQSWNKYSSINTSEDFNITNYLAYFIGCGGETNFTWAPTCDYCGDGICKDQETCSSCYNDCGFCSSSVGPGGSGGSSKDKPLFQEKINTSLNDSQEVEGSSFFEEISPQEFQEKNSSEKNSNIKKIIFSFIVLSIFILVPIIIFFSIKKVINMKGERKVISPLNQVYPPYQKE